METGWQGSKELDCKGRGRERQWLREGSDYEAIFLSLIQVKIGERKEMRRGSN